MSETVAQEELFDEAQVATEGQADAKDEAPDADAIAEAVESFDKPKEEPKHEEAAEEDQAPAKGDSSVIRELRKQNRDMSRDLRKLRQEINQKAAEKDPELGPKPTLETVDYDSARFERETEAWLIRKRAHDEKVNAQKAAEEEVAKKYQDKIAAYGAAKSALNLPDYDEAEDIVRDLLDTAQQSIIVQGAKKPELLVYALGKNEETAKKLAEIKEPIAFTYEVARLEARLEAQMKEAKKRPATQPEGKVTGGSGTVDSTLERLRAEAEKTGDYSRVTAYKRAKQS